MKLKQSHFVKIRIAVPVKSANRIRKVLGDLGAGKQGNYTQCTGSWRQVGRFLPMSGSRPAIGKTGKQEKVIEEVIETLCEAQLVPKIISAIKKVHPYEEPAIDIFPRLDF